MTKHKKWGFIVNPIAGNGIAMGMVDRLHNAIKKFGITAEVTLTKARGHATQLATELVDRGCTHIIAVGGDGTVNESATALINQADIVFGLLPAGTGNDFAQVIGFPETFTEDHWQMLLHPQCIRMDVGKCNDRYFFNGMGLGFDAQVASENFDEKAQAKTGPGKVYLWHILKNLFFYQEKMFISQNGESSERTKTFMKTISIGRRFAGGYFLTPHAVANDGLLDVCLVEPVNLIERFRLFLKVPTGTHIESRKVKYYRTQSLKIEFEYDVPHHLDGELYFAKSFDISILPQQLNIIYNPNGNHFFKISS